MRAYVEKSEFGFVGRLCGCSYLFGDLIDESNPENDKEFRKALSKFLGNIPKSKRAKVRRGILKNWERYVEFAKAELGQKSKTGRK